MAVVGTVVCGNCGVEFEAQSRRAVYCSARCRKAANRRGGAPAGGGASAGGSGPAADAVTRGAEAPAGPAKPAAPPPPEYDTLADQVQASLAEANALTTISGMAALRVAQQIDRGRDTGSAVATLVNALTRLVGEAKVEAAPKNRDRVSEVEDAVVAKLHLLAAG